VIVPDQIKGKCLVCILVGDPPQFLKV